MFGKIISKMEIVKKEVKKESAKKVKTVDAKHPEKTVLLMACLNPAVSKKAIDAAKENGVSVVILEDKIIYDYLSAKDEKKEDAKGLDEFLSDATNRIHAGEQCVKLWEILTAGEPIENSGNRVFSSSEVVKKTNLTYSRAKSLFQLLRAFGMLEYIKGTHEFTLNFEQKRQQQTIQTEVLSMCTALNNDVLRYKKSVEADKNLTAAQKNILFKSLKKSIGEIIEL